MFNRRVIDRATISTSSIDGHPAKVAVAAFRLTRVTRVLLTALVILEGHATFAQSRPPRAEVTPVVAASPVAPGTTARLTANVKLPAGIHVQSDKPRDPFLIPTALTVKPPAGLVVEGITYPKATDFAQAGRKEPLAVFGAEFSIGVLVNVAADLPAGEVVVPAQLRYQACDDKVCFAPARADVRWTLRVARP